MCLNYRVQHKFLQCRYCNEHIILNEDEIVDEPIYCEYCYNKMFRGGLVCFENVYLDKFGDNRMTSDFMRDLL